ncbi:MAG: hypothetical protein AMS22_01715 [Thiotrichales bacterium SG8_50]|nr:MAG: hypothetical protein AMS22_01715 [Thiotrichales bacterium SG8_50]
MEPTAQVQPQPEERRRFPRIVGRCPVLYAASAESRRHVAVLIDYSAVGMKFSCKEPLAVGARLVLETKPGSNRTIPAFKADSVVVRCEPAEAGAFLISCRMVNVSRPGT